MRRHVRAWLVAGLLLAACDTSSSVEPMRKFRPKVSKVALPENLVSANIGAHGLYSVETRHPTFEQSILRMDPDTGEVLKRRLVETKGLGVVADGEEFLWVAEHVGRHRCGIFKMDPVTLRTLAHVEVFKSGCNPLYEAGGYLWTRDDSDDTAGRPDHVVARSLDNMEPVFEVEVGRCCISDFAHENGSLWLSRVDVAAFVLPEESSGPSPTVVSHLLEIDIEQRALVREIRVKAGDSYGRGDLNISDIEITDGVLWGAMPTQQGLFRMDLSSGAIRYGYEIPNPIWLAPFDDLLLVRSPAAVRALDADTGKRLEGEILLVNVAPPLVGLDGAVSFHNERGLVRLEP